MNKKTIILLAVSPIILSVLGALGYFAYHFFSAQEAKNKEALKSFGSDLAPISQQPASDELDDGPSYRYDGVVSSTFAEEELQPHEKVISGLKVERSRLIQDNRSLESQIASLRERVAELEHYKKVNERFAPESIQEELREVETELNRLLLKDASIVQYNNRQVEMMTLASVQAYHRFIRANRALLTAAQRDSLMLVALPDYAFCIGDGIDVAANTTSEERALLTYFKTESAADLSRQLRDDLALVMEPCEKALGSEFSRLDD